MIAKKFLVLIVPEHGTTKYCSVCNEELLPPDHEIVKDYLRFSGQKFTTKDCRNVRCCPAYHKHNSGSCNSRIAFLLKLLETAFFAE